ncbi:TOX high mobility group box family member 4 [Episyrphus balteatus]|uniref:TOX high mobility group box family member 4 n=1 Tax=Episyrphus balteatus TaxID=286459 RepID=UPI0024858AC9|nr:TOX high mobility group box family member 4 [Episyrphus balteatus]
MNAQFHTPSFGDEEFDLTDVDPEPTIQVSNANRFNAINHHHQQQHQQVSTNNLDAPEPVKPVSAYALFFRDTVSAIKVQNPNTSFEEISKIVSSMWQVLDPTHKNVYNKKSDLAKKEYIQKMAAFRSSQMRQVVQEESVANNYDQENIIQHPNISPKQITSRPVVFTISPRANDSHSSMINDQQTQEVGQNNVYSNNVNSQQQQTTGNQQPQNVQLVNEAGSVQICLRENCNKRAIINPDWEDEYCSNECVVIHCRNVFNQWVKSNSEE